MLERIAKLVELSDVCICVGFSLSLREIVGRHGRSPDPAKVAALSEWGTIDNLKQLQLRQLLSRPTRSGGISVKETRRSQ